MGGGFSELQEKDQSRERESEGESPPYSCCLDVKRKGKEIAEWKRNDPVCDNRSPYQRLDSFDGSQGVGEYNLCAVAELVEHER